MVLAFKKQFVEPIKNNDKVHTIREDKNNRWKTGNKIHFATGVRTKNYNQFFDGVCKSVQTIEIKTIDDPGLINYVRNDKPVGVFVDGKRLKIYEIDLLASKDGFENALEFFKWFDKDFKGKLIHWTDLKY